MLSKLSDVKLIDFPVKPSDAAVLSVYEHPKDVPFAINRVFLIHAAQETARGAHAHYKCNQLLVAIHGRVFVTIDDGADRLDVDLNTSSQGVYIPAGLWATQHYDEGAILMVLASDGYNEADYIRDYTAYKLFRSA